MKNECPYRTSDGKCVHKGSGGINKKKPKCPYNDENKCRMHNEWLELINSSDDSLNHELRVLGDEDE